MNPGGIPTGAYQLFRVATPLDPEPKGPVFDGGVMVSDGQTRPSTPAVIPTEVSAIVVSNVAQVAAINTPDELRNKYLLIDIQKERVALLTLAEHASRGDVLVDSNRVRSSNGQIAPLSQDMLSRLMEDSDFRKPVLTVTEIRVCGMIPGTEGLKGVQLEKFLAARDIQVPTTSDLTTACAICYATTGRHLIPLGRTVRASDGVIRVSRVGQLNVFLGNPDQFADDVNTVTAGKVRLGEQSTRKGGGKSLLKRLGKWAGLQLL